MWETAWFCVSCDGELSYGQRMRNHGRCPLCGEKAGNANTIVATYEKAVRVVRINPWWKFWKPMFKREFREDR